MSKNDELSFLKGLEDLVVDEKDQDQTKNNETKKEEKTKNYNRNPLEEIKEKEKKKNSKKEIVSFSLPDEVNKALSNFSSNNHLTKSCLVTQLLLKFLKENNY